MGRGSSKLGNTASAFKPTNTQREYEERYRGTDVEHGAFIDGEGNIMLEAIGTRDYVEFEYHDVNHQVEQPLWNGAEVNFTHNHTENTVFSPEDLESFEEMESHSESAVLPNGTTYRLIRNQPRTSNVWDTNPVTGEFEPVFIPKKIAPAYDAEYRRILSTWDRSRGHYPSVDFWENTLTPHMANWLRQNASNYGYIFVEERK